MLKHIKIAYRFLLRHRQYSLVNILGLTLSLAVVLIIALYLHDELSFDRTHVNSKRIYRVIEKQVDKHGQVAYMAGVAFRTSNLQSEIPDIEMTVKFTSFGRTMVSNDENENKFYEQYAFTEQSFLEIFDYELLLGSRDNVLTEPNTVIITQSTAKRFFGTDNVVGKLIQTDRQDAPYTISGVLKDFPSNSHLDFNMLFSFSTLHSEDWYKRFETSDWSSNYFTVYYLLRPDANAEAIAATLTQTINNNRGEDDSKSTYWLQPLTDIHFTSAEIRGGFTTSYGEMSYVYIFGAVGVFILIIALVNYINLATAMSITRGKEIGVKKVTGANRSSLAMQFISESTIMALLAMLVALALASLLIPSFNTFTGKTIDIGLFMEPMTALTIVAFTLLVGLLAGGYPAFRLSKLRPLLAMKGGAKSTPFSWMRRGLVVFQFFLSITLIIATLTAYHQIEFIRTKNLGFNEEQLVVADINSGIIRQGASIVKNEIEKMHGVSSVTISSRVPGEWKNLPQVMVNTTDNTNVSCYFIGADEDYLETFQMKHIAGMNFRENYPGDSSSILINETAAKQLGITEPGEDVIIPSVNLAVNDELLDEPFRARVIGIVADFNFQSLHQQIAPLVIGYQNNPIHSIDYFTIRMSSENMDARLKQIQAIMYTVDPNHLLEYNFLDERLADFYRQDVQRGKLFAIAAVVAIGLACLGLFSLVSFNTELRTKEIGVRKVLGATIYQITVMLCSEYVKLVAIGFLIAIPVALWALNEWLSSFAYRIEVNWLILAAASIISFIVTIVTVGFKSLKAAATNPADSLRTE